MSSLYPLAFFSCTTQPYVMSWPLIYFLSVRSYLILSLGDNNLILSTSLDLLLEDIWLPYLIGHLIWILSRWSIIISEEGYLVFGSMDIIIRFWEYMAYTCWMHGGHLLFIYHCALRHSTTDMHWTCIFNITYWAGLCTAAPYCALHLAYRYLLCIAALCL